MTDLVVPEIPPDEGDTLLMFYLVSLCDQDDFQKHFEEVGEKKDGYSLDDDDVCCVDGVVGGYIPISDGGDVSDRPVKSVKIFDAPIFLRNVVLKSRIIDPAVVRRVRPINIVLVDPVVKSIVTNCHPVRPQKHEENYSAHCVVVTPLEPVSDQHHKVRVQLVGCYQFEEEQKFEEVEYYPGIEQGHQHAEEGEQVEPQIESDVPFEYYDPVLDQDSFLVIGLEGADYDISQEEYDKEDIPEVEVSNLCTPVLIPEADQKTYLVEVEEYDSKIDDAPDENPCPLGHQDVESAVFLQ